MQEPSVSAVNATHGPHITLNQYYIVLALLQMYVIDIAGASFMTIWMPKIV